jgi:hypothetical protein
VSSRKVVAGLVCALQIIGWIVVSASSAHADEICPYVTVYGERYMMCCDLPDVEVPWQYECRMYP